jgi:hypothetical protein
MFNKYAGEEVNREYLRNNINITYSGFWTAKSITGSGSGSGSGVGINQLYKFLLHANKPKETLVHQLGITGSFSGTMGLMFSAGFTWDNKGNYGLYGTIGFNHGIDISLGGEYIQSRVIDKNTNFDINSLNGRGINYNLGVLMFDGAYGGDTNGVGNYSEKAGSSYNSYSGGVSVGIPIGFTRSIEHTKVWQLNKKRK